MSKVVGYKIRGLCGDTICEISASPYDPFWTKEEAQEKANIENKTNKVYSYFVLVPIVREENE